MPHLEFKFSRLRFKSLLELARLSAFLSRCSNVWNQNEKKNRGTPQKIKSEITHRKSGGHCTRILQRRLVSWVAGFPDLADQDDYVFDGNGRD